MKARPERDHERDAARHAAVQNARMSRTLLRACVPACTWFAKLYVSMMVERINYLMMARLYSRLYQSRGGRAGAGSVRHRSIFFAEIFLTPFTIESCVLKQSNFPPIDSKRKGRARASSGLSFFLPRFGDRLVLQRWLSQASVTKGRQKSLGASQPPPE